MIYPLVRELAVDGIPVTVTCRVLKIARQPYYRWLAQPVTEADWVQARRANALFDAHREDVEFGYRFLASSELCGCRDPRAVLRWWFGGHPLVMRRGRRCAARSGGARLRRCRAAGP
jgi:hypothetical protein